MTRGGRAAVGAAAWAAAWWAPWPHGLAAWPWLAAAAALAIVVVPGACAARLLGGRRSGPDVVGGFVVSVAAIEVIGLGGCALGVAPAAVPAAFGLLALVPVALVAARRPAPPGRVRWAAAVPLLAAAAVAAWVAALPDAGGDNFVYNAMVTDFARGERLGFADPVFADRPTVSRFWLAQWPMVLAVWSRASGIDPLQLSAVYVAPFLAALAALAAARLGRGLGLSPRLAALAAVVQVAALLVLTAQHQPGWAFFTRIREDKVVAAFLIVPAWLALAAELLRRPARGRAALVGIGGAATLLTHPTICGAALLVLGLFAGLDALMTRRLRPALVVLAIGAAMGAVLVGVRIGGAAASLRFHTSVESALAAGDVYFARAKRLEIDADGRRYRVRPALLGAVPIAALLAAGGLALTRLRTDPAARYVLAAGAVSLAVLAVPSAMLLGYLLTAFHIWRVPWLAPFGIAAALAAAAGAAAIPAAWPARPAARWSPVGAVLAQLALLAAAALAPRGLPEHFVVPPDWQRRAYWRKSHLAPCVPSFVDLARLGAAIDAAAGRRPLVLGDRVVNDYLPAASARAALLVFRSPEFEAELGVPDRERRRALAGLALDVSAPPARRLAALGDAGVRFAVECDGGAGLAELGRAAGGALRLRERFGALSLYEMGATDAPPARRANGGEPSARGLRRGVRHRALHSRPPTG